MREIQGLFLLSFGFIGWVLTYYLSRITGQLANQTQSFQPSGFVGALFYFVFTVFIISGIYMMITSRKKK